ncbi:MAG: L-seryl-tRNA(Sec) selenium transferase [Oscillospiraceae bacterium]|nr:L-seryl-tRNA(Sec) selenium transferase [Oscillospiraceae bacterium]
MDPSPLRGLPNMNSLLEHPLLRREERGRVKVAAQKLLDKLRSEVLSGRLDRVPSAEDCALLVLEELKRKGKPSLRGVVNATGIVLHTNLGRAPLGQELYDLAREVYSGYSSLEYDIETGTRGSRYAHVEGLICALTGAEAAMVVNNNAAAVFLMLTALAEGKQVAISRGELVEIGGSFRIPDIMARSGASLTEVGTTNRTRLPDYEAAVHRGAELLMKVHTSNYEIVGFTESVSVAELAALARREGKPLLYDMGSCFLFDPKLPWLPECKTARAGIEAGADVISFSGDKLLGSAQAGILAGRRELLEAMKKHPLSRMLRPDKLTLQALEAALAIYQYPEEAMKRIPVLRMLSVPQEELLDRAAALVLKLSDLRPDWEILVRKIMDETGGGALPNVSLPGYAAGIVPRGRSVEALEEELRRSDVPVIGRLHRGELLLSVRTLLPGDEERIASAIAGLPD